MKYIKDSFIKYVLFLTVILFLLIVVSLFACVTIESIPFFKEIGINGFIISGGWNPLKSEASYSLLPMILATLYVSFLAVFIALPIGLGCAIFLSFYSKKSVSKTILACIDLLAGIPSVIFGFIGLVIIVKYFEIFFNMTSGECVLAAGILLAIMLLPYIISNCSESIDEAKNKFEIESLSLGVSKEYTIKIVILPSIKNSIYSAIMMSFGRAMGETMAVMMVMGNSPIMPRLFSRGETIPSLTALEMGTVQYGSLHSSALYAANVVLIFLLIIIFAIAKYLKIKSRME
ncbi:phosphate ABC transporter permease subunit PstC [Terrisporobacter petrolearius]|uniref:phosphate ABC transporter permease subunit PstC n=1 Tax=Terrisporobacter petrolearius TaxID=1460447 RepID=UPI001D160B6D|nr:phosphate ABC transporter permease subunit PstC [Terrisporobacter petrolearius]MCC3863231.1 phosphate ABC transporter permease subunit PstC [Terrisporobacter petrolearius]